MLLAIISDTHCRSLDRLPQSCVARLRESDVILHAGDFTDPQLFAELRELGPQLAGVHGNVDAAELRSSLPHQRVVEAGGARIAMVHDAGAARGRLERMRSRFPDADALVFGHSHLPLVEAADGFQIFNPGSPTQRRRAPAHTMGVARVEDGRVRFDLIRLD